MQVFVTINKDGIMTNADVNVKNSLTKECVIKDLFESSDICCSLAHFFLVTRKFYHPITTTLIFILF